MTAKVVSTVLIMKNTKIQTLRASMQTHQLAACILPNTDPHQSEYIAEYWNIIQHLSGFTGSTANMVVTNDFAGLWTDSRYFIQAEKELQNSDVELVKLKVPHTPEYINWLAETLAENSRVGVDARLFSVALVRRMEQAFALKNIQIEEVNLFSEGWSGRPSLPAHPLFIHDTQYTGKNCADKLTEVSTKMTQLGATHHLVTTLDDIAWLFNIRGTDVAYNPVVTSYALIEVDRATLFVQSAALSEADAQALKSQGVTIAEYETIQTTLNNLPASATVLYDKAKTSLWLRRAIAGKTIAANNISTGLKAIKNEKEIEGIRKVMERDGVALVQFYKWLEENIGRKPITEISAAAQLNAFRAQQKNYVGESFGAISGYQEHGALPHYKSTPESNVALQAEGMYLLDSGGQYLDGTTDTTRTITLGKPTEAEKRNFTLVLKGMIQLTCAIFPKGTKGIQLDILARQALWQDSKNYGHGTGHGVGFFLNVHEGPQSIGTGATAQNAPLMPGMVTSNEPGFYLEGAYGIRIENLILTIPHKTTAFGEFYTFETLTLCPIDKQLVDKALLTAQEIDWLNDYHQLVFERLTPLMNEEESKWLKARTTRI